MGCTILHATLQLRILGAIIENLEGTCTKARVFLHPINSQGHTGASPQHLSFVGVFAMANLKANMQEIKMFGCFGFGNIVECLSTLLKHMPWIFTSSLAFKEAKNNEYCQIYWQLQTCRRSFILKDFRCINWWSFYLRWFFLYIEKLNWLPSVLTTAF